MTGFVVYGLFLSLLAVGAVYLIFQSSQRVIQGLQNENRELRDRLYQKHALPPSGVDLTEKYEAKQEREREQRDAPRTKKSPLGPIERMTEKWAAKDRDEAERKNVDVTQPRKFIN